MAAGGGHAGGGFDDRANLFGALEYSSYAKDAGVQPIIGCAIAGLGGIGAGPTERWARAPTITLLAQNERGYLNLSELSSIAYLESGELAEPIVPWAKVVEHAEGLILLSGGTDGPVDALFASGKTAEARRLWPRCSGFSATASMSSCNATACRARPPPSRAWSTGPMSTTCRWSPPTTSITPSPNSTTPTTRCCASPTAPSWARTNGDA
jgi:hypothetical protein